MTQMDHRHSPAPTSIAAYRVRSRAASGGPLQGSAATPDEAGGASADAQELEAFFAAASAESAESADPHGGDCHGIVASVLSRGDRVPAIWGPVWGRFLSLMDRHRENPRAAVNSGVLANLVGLAMFGDEADFVSLAELTDSVGRERATAVQHRVARFIEPNPTFPVTTAALRRMVPTASPFMGPVLDSAVALLLEGVDLDLNLPLIRTEAELAGVVDAGNVPEWRHHLSMVAVNPWSPYSRQLADLARQAGRPPVAELIERFTEVCREQDQERERKQVTEEIRRLISVSGVTQREFAQWVGTSAPRLSTYLSGTVTPSASLMLRMKRVSRLLQEREASASARSRQARNRTRAGRGSVRVSDLGPTSQTFSDTLAAPRPDCRRQLRSPRAHQLDAGARTTTEPKILNDANRVQLTLSKSSYLDTVFE